LSVLDVNRSSDYGVNLRLFFSSYTLNDAAIWLAMTKELLRLGASPIKRGNMPDQVDPLATVLWKLGNMSEEPGYKRNVRFGIRTMEYLIHHGAGRNSMGSREPSAVGIYEDYTTNFHTPYLARKLRAHFIVRSGGYELANKRVWEEDPVEPDA
jgi:hypothetical protein